MFSLKITKKISPVLEGPKKYRRKKHLGRIKRRVRKWGRPSSNFLLLSPVHFFGAKMCPVQFFPDVFPIKIITRPKTTPKHYRPPCPAPKLVTVLFFTRASIRPWLYSENIFYSHKISSQFFTWVLNACLFTWVLQISFFTWVFFKSRNNDKPARKTIGLSGYRNRSRSIK